MLSFEVDEEMSGFVAEQVAEGSYANAGDYLRDLIRNDRDALACEMSPERLAYLREAFAQPPGAYVEANAETFLSEMRQRYRTCEE